MLKIPFLRHKICDQVPICLLYNIRIGKALRASRWCHDRQHSYRHHLSIAEHDAPLVPAVDAPLCLQQVVRLAVPLELLARAEVPFESKFTQSPVNAVFGPGGPFRLFVITASKCFLKDVLFFDEFLALIHSQSLQVDAILLVIMEP